MPRLQHKDWHECNVNNFKLEQATHTRFPMTPALQLDQMLRRHVGCEIIDCHLLSALSSTPVN